MKKLFCLLIVLCLCSCGEDRSSLETYQKTARIDNGLVDRYQPAQSPTEEYVSRIAKRMSTVSDSPSSNYTVRVLNTEHIEFSVDRETKTVTISTGSLSYLKDEAQLATVLTIAMFRLDNTKNIDLATAITLANAGYDPQAMLDLQEEYFYAADKQQNWLGAVFPYPPTASSIIANKEMLQKMPKGLTRNTEEYNQQING